MIYLLIFIWGFLVAFFTFINYENLKENWVGEVLDTSCLSIFWFINLPVLCFTAIARR